MTTPTLDLPVDFGGISYGDETARLSCRAARDSISLDDADANLCGKRLELELVAMPAGSLPGQQQLPDMDEKLKGIADVKRFGVGVDEISFGLTFALSSIDKNQLLEFRKRSGRIVITHVEVLPDGDEEDGDGASFDDHEDTGPMPKVKPARGARPLPGTVDAGAAMPLMTLTKKIYAGGMTKRKIEAVIAACGGDTIGAFEEWTRKNEFWTRDVPGIGAEWLTKFQDAWLAFRLAHPVPQEDGSISREVAKECYEAGCNAALANQPLGSNPHRDGTERNAQWADGWRDTNKVPDTKSDDDGTVFDGKHADNGKAESTPEPEMTIEQAASFVAEHGEWNNGWADILKTRSACKGCIKKAGLALKDKPELRAMLKRAIAAIDKHFAEAAAAK